MPGPGVKFVARELGRGHQQRETNVRDADRLKDPATGLASEWHFEILLDFFFPVAHRGVNMTLVLFGIDEGSWTEGQPNSEQQVTNLGAAIGSVTRSTDLVARYGDDLFICLLPLCNAQGRLIFADRIRDAISDYTRETGTTVSAGIASYRGDDEGTKEDMLQALKGALVAAWGQGGDCVEIPKDGWNH
jgi:diguanylate cyclase (GGDEF)-like protein